MFKKSLIYMLLLLFSLATACVPRNVKKKNFRDQDPLYCEHDPKYDLKKHKKTKYGILILDNNNYNLDKNEIGKTVIKSLKASNLKSLNVIQYDKLINLANNKKQLKRIKKINTSFNETGILLKNDLRLLGKRLRIHYFLIPVIKYINVTEDYKTVTIDQGKTRAGFS